MPNKNQNTFRLEPNRLCYHAEVPRGIEVSDGEKDKTVIHPHIPMKAIRHDTDTPGTRNDIALARLYLDSNPFSVTKARQVFVSIDAQTGKYVWDLKFDKSEPVDKESFSEEEQAHIEELFAEYGITNIKQAKSIEPIERKEEFYLKYNEITKYIRLLNSDKRGILSNAIVLLEYNEDGNEYDQELLNEIKKLYTKHGFEDVHELLGCKDAEKILIFIHEYAELTGKDEKKLTRRLQSLRNKYVVNEIVITNKEARKELFERGQRTEDGKLIIDDALMAEIAQKHMTEEELAWYKLAKDDYEKLFEDESEVTNADLLNADEQYAAIEQTYGTVVAESFTNLGITVVNLPEFGANNQAEFNANINGEPIRFRATKSPETNDVTFYVIDENADNSEWEVETVSDNKNQNNFEASLGLVMRKMQVNRVVNKMLPPDTLGRDIDRVWLDTQMMVAYEIIGPRDFPVLLTLIKQEARYKNNGYKKVFIELGLQPAEHVAGIDDTMKDHVLRNIKPALRKMRMELSRNGNRRADDSTHETYTKFLSFVKKGVNV